MCNSRDIHDALWDHEQRDDGEDYKFKKYKDVTTGKTVGSDKIRRPPKDDDPRGY